MAAVLAVAVVDGGRFSSVLADRPGGGKPAAPAAPAKPATTTPEQEAAAEFLRVSGAVLPPPDGSNSKTATARRKRRRAEKGAGEGRAPAPPPANETRSAAAAAAASSPSELLRAERRAWRSKHHHGAVEANGDTPASMPRRRLDGGDGDGDSSSGSGTGSDRGGDEGRGDDEDGGGGGGGSGCETDDALDPTKVCM